MKRHTDIFGAADIECYEFSEQVEVSEVLFCRQCLNALDLVLVMSTYTF